MRLGHEAAGIDLYDLLGVARSATPAEIRAAYRRAVRTSHPDLNPNDPRSGERMAHVNLAGRVLLDSYLREAYDRLTPEVAAGAAAAWYERGGNTPAEWVEPPRSTAPRAKSRDLRRFLSELRSFDAKASLSFSELVARTPERAKLPLVALTIGCALLLIACARPRALFPWDDRQQPTSVAPGSMSP
ncbi:MAG TPA: J domain-containing protein [Polyangiaceae bacterium]|jgi:curved DNA-binding protein CbpA|nr:J domain-containing protein [Polyangiaceae bacterium]